MKPTLAVIAAVLGLAALGLVIAWQNRQVRPGTDIASVEKDIQQHLPIGSARAQVTAYLDERKISHGYTSKLKELPDYRYKHTEIAIIRDASRKGLFRTDIQIVFRFGDSDERLVGYSVKYIVKGL
jgi:hypothetical protein